MSQAPTRTQITLFPLHSGRDGKGQVEIDQNPARFKVVICGRRWGKTVLGVRTCVKYALSKGGIYFWIGPTYASVVISQAWPKLKFLASQIPGSVVKEAEQCVTFPNGGQIWVKSADNPDSLRGGGLSGVVLDECAQIKEVTWTEVIQPSLADYKGWALFIGTPKGKNWVYRLYKAAGAHSDWAAWSKPTTDNPYIDVDEVERARYTMSEESFAQEYMADFGASQYLVFPEVIPDVHEWRGPVPEFDRYYGGMDFGGDTIGAHKSTANIAGLTAKDELVFFAAFEQSGPNIAERQYNWVVEQDLKLATLHKELKRPFNGVLYRADKTQSLGIQFMRRLGVHVYPTVGGPDSVNDGIELVHRRLKVREDGHPRMFWLKGTPWIQDALMRYRYPEPAADDRVQHKNPLKVDDDTIDGVRYTVEGVDRQITGNPQEMYSRQIARIAQ